MDYGACRKERGTVGFDNFYEYKPHTHDYGLSTIGNLGNSKISDTSRYTLDKPSYGGFSGGFGYKGLGAGAFSGSGGHGGHGGHGGFNKHDSNDSISNFKALLDYELSVDGDHSFGGQGGHGGGHGGDIGGFGGGHGGDLGFGGFGGQNDHGGNTFSGGYGQ